MLSLVGGEPLHAEATEGSAEETGSDRKGEDPPPGGAQQGHPGSQQTREPLSGAAAAEQVPQGTFL